MNEQHRVVDTEPVTLINVFEIPTEQVATFIEAWSERARIMSRHPGFRDSILHRALSPDGRFQLVNVAHWDSLQAYTAAHEDPQFQASRDQAAQDPRLTATPQLYEVVAGYTLPPGVGTPVSVVQSIETGY